jgi:hypothetical protein
MKAKGFKDFRYRILKKYSMLVDFEGEPRTKNIPNPVVKETFKQWKERVLGESVTDVVVYMPDRPRNNTLVNTLQNKTNAERIENIFRSIEKAKDQQKREAIEENTKEPLNNNLNIY